MQVFVVLSAYNFPSLGQVNTHFCDVGSAYVILGTDGH